MFFFTNRRRQCQIEGVMRRIVDQTTPSLALIEGDDRCHSRYNRNLPVLLTSWQDQSVIVEESVVGLTKDISDHGLAVILTQPVSDHQDVAATFWLTSRESADEAPVTLLGHTCHCIDIGGGFALVGIELIERLENQTLLEQLLPSARQLLPRALQATTVMELS